MLSNPQDSSKTPTQSRPKLLHPWEAPDSLTNDQLSFLDHSSEVLWGVHIKSHYDLGRELLAVKDHFRLTGDYFSKKGWFGDWVSETLPFDIVKARRLIGFAYVINNCPEYKDIISSWSYDSVSRYISGQSPVVQNSLIEIYLNEGFTGTALRETQLLMHDSAVVAANLFDELVNLQKQEIELNQLRQNLSHTHVPRDTKSDKQPIYKEGAGRCIGYRITPECETLDTQIRKTIVQKNLATEASQNALTQVCQEESTAIDFDNEEEVKALVKRRLEAKLQSIRAEEASKKAAPKKAPKPPSAEPEETTNLYQLVTYMDHCKRLLKEFYEHTEDYPDTLQKDVMHSLEDLLTLISDNRTKHKP